jgi:hypothetical protein
MNQKPQEYKPYPDSGSLRSTSIKKGPKSPDYWGNIAINLKDTTNVKTQDGLTIVKLSGWKKVGNDGKTYLSIAVDRFVPESKGETPKRQDDNFGDDDVPF